MKFLEYEGRPNFCKAYPESKEDVSYLHKTYGAPLIRDYEYWVIAEVPEVKPMTSEQWTELAKISTRSCL